MPRLDCDFQVVMIGGGIMKSVPVRGTGPHAGALYNQKVQERAVSYGECVPYETEQAGHASVKNAL